MSKQETKTITIGFKHMAFAIIIIGVIVWLIMLGQGNANGSNQQGGVQGGSGEFQEVTLRTGNYQYRVEPSTMRVGIPVRMTVDLSTVYGCARSVVIPSFGVKKVVGEGNNIIEFTPTKTGKIDIMCSMRMWKGSFEVV